MVTLDTNIIHYKELFVHGTHGSMPIHHRKALELIASGAINAKDYNSHNFGLDDVIKAFKMTESHKGMRVIVNP